jgi:hypothetical protein
MGGKYSTYANRQESVPVKKEVHPIWRGIGFAMIIIVPFLSYIGSLVILEQNGISHWFPIPADLIATGTDPLLYIKIIITICLIFIIFAVFNFLTFVIFRIFGPARYSPLDAPPEMVRRRGR